MPTLVTVITATFNRAHTLERAIASVRQQQGASWQHVIVDDGSTDPTPSLLEPLARDPRYVCLRQDNQGCIASLNRGAELAAGEYLAFLDSDDELLPHHLQSSIATGADLIWGAASAVGPEAAQYYDDLEKPGERAHVSICCLNTGLVVRKMLWDKLGGYRNLLSFDANLKQRAAALGAHIVQRLEPSVVVHCDGGDRLSDVVRSMKGSNASTATAMPDQHLVRDRLG